MDMHVGEDFLSRARRLVVDYDHSEADALFDDVLSRTIFSFRTNRMIFRQMIRFQGYERWQRVFDRVLAKSRFDLPDPTVDDYFARSFDQVIGYFRDRGTSSAASLDPVGELSLRLAKKARRIALSDHTVDHPEVLAEMAEDFFPFAVGPLRYWPEVSDPDFAPAITAQRRTQVPGTREPRHD